MLRDRYDNELSTHSDKARDYYVDGVDRILSGSAAMMEPFENALAIDLDFSLAQCGLARAAVLSGDMPAAKSAIAKAGETLTARSGREASHVNAMALLLSGKSVEALKAVREHLAEYPRDALIAQLASSVFGLIGFSGQPGREADLLAYTASLLPHYGDDWWMLSQHAFSLCETGQLSAASDMIDRSLAINSDCSHSAHIRSHIYYEEGNVDDGIAYLENWLPSYERSALMHGHLSWHVALWALEQGDTERMWRTVDADVQPGAAQGLPINILTDTASILHRAEMSGEVVAKDRWFALSEYAAQSFPNLGNGFVDFHAALAHAMAGRSDRLQCYLSDAKGPAADLVAPCSAAFDAIAHEKWSEATGLLSNALADDARLGGSRAQRDLLDLCLANTLIRQGKAKEAERILRLRRPVLVKEPR